MKNRLRPNGPLVTVVFAAVAAVALRPGDQSHWGVLGAEPAGHGDG